jgi:hypothetical protein
MAQTLQIINIAVLLILMGYGLNRLLRQGAEKKKKDQKKHDDGQEMQRWEEGALLASEDKEYMTFVNDITGLGKEYDMDQWYFKMPESAIKHLEVCFSGDEKKVLFMKRAIELTIEHYVAEMKDDAACAKIIEERVFSNPNRSTVPFDIEEYKRYRQEREQCDGEFETLAQWKQRCDNAAAEPSDNT